MAKATAQDERAELAHGLAHEAYDAAVTSIMEGATDLGVLLAALAKCAHMLQGEVSAARLLFAIRLADEDLDG